jgi:hypothetical protein
MNEKRIDRIINILYAFAAISVLLGAFFRLQHYPYGSHMFWGGSIVGIIVSTYDNIRLKKIIKKLEEGKFSE